MEIGFINVALVPVVLGVVSAIKTIGINAKWAPVLSILLGIAGVLLIQGFDAESVIIGIGTGLAASGLYSGGKTMLE